MKFGLLIPTIGTYASVRKIVEIASVAEASGWEGTFLWDVLLGFSWWNRPPACDSWIALTAIAVATERVRLGTMITPVARRRPWKLARETVTLDRLSRGRLTLGVGLGNPPDEFSLFGEDSANRVRAGKLDEGLDILTGLWSGEAFSYHGDHYQLENVHFRPPPIQRPRIPIWVGGRYPNKGPWRRAARFDGVYPEKFDDNGHPEPLSVAELGTILDEVRLHRHSSDPFDVVVSAPPDAPGVPSVREYAEAGATWCLSNVDALMNFDQACEQVRAGPTLF